MWEILMLRNRSKLRYIIKAFIINFDAEVD